ncbi:hypothetical protein Tco_0910833 [Tanacetum coccineum]|uniref:Retroviral polymerase SH3-like domain-containing protein n=1 Tax=Tanacetum coccineum TaxID=301880 RepID=A0ABQ5CW71_9ASTR
MYIRQTYLSLILMVWKKDTDSECIQKAICNSVSVNYANAMDMQKSPFNMENGSPDANNTTNVHTSYVPLILATVESRHTEHKQLEQIRCNWTPDNRDNRNTGVKHSLPQMYDIDGSNSMVVNRRPSGFKNVLRASPHTIAPLDINNCTTQNTIDGVTVPSRRTEQQHFKQRRCNLACVDRNIRDEEQEQTRNRWSMESLLKVDPQTYQRSAIELRFVVVIVKQWYQSYWLLWSEVEVWLFVRDRGLGFLNKSICKKMRCLLIQHGWEDALDPFPETMAGAEKTAVLKTDVYKKAHSVLILCLDNKLLRLIDEDQALMLLTSLPPSYEYFVQTLLYGRESLTLEDVLSSLNLRELKKRTNANDDGDGLYVKGRSDHQGSLRKMSNKETKKTTGFYQGRCGQGSGMHSEGYDNGDLLMAVSEERFLEWIMDSGGSFHMPRRDFLFDFKEFNGEGYTVKLQNRRVKVIKGSLMVLSGTMKGNYVYSLDGWAESGEASNEDSASSGGEAVGGKPDSLGEEDAYGQAQARGYKCIFLGYPDGVKGYRLWRLDDGAGAVDSGKEGEFEVELQGSRVEPNVDPHNGENPGNEDEEQDEEP